jgi:hypothetical protein
MPVRESGRALGPEGQQGFGVGFGDGTAVDGRGGESAEETYAPRA